MIFIKYFFAFVQGRRSFPYLFMLEGSSHLLKIKRCSPHLFKTEGSSLHLDFEIEGSFPHMFKIEGSSRHLFKISR